MIIDFNIPVHNGKEWTIDVHKTLPSGKLFIQKMRFENNDDAFEYYNFIQEVYKRQQQRSR